MYKLLIVDDELVIRDGLTNIVDWDNMGYEVVKSLQDGGDAIEFIKHNNVDVILTDIKMVHVSGLEVAKYIFEKKLNVKVVLLSGFKEFELAKTAIKYNVHHYLLKPTDFDELIQVFSELKKILDDEKNKLVISEKEKKQYLNLVKEQFFIDLTMGGICDKQKIIKRIRLIGLPENIEKRCCCIIYLDINDYEKFLETKWFRGKEMLNTAFHNLLCGESNNLIYHLINNNTDKLQMLILCEKEYSVSEFKIKVKHFIDKLTHSIKMLIGLEIVEKSSEYYKDIQTMTLKRSMPLVPIQKQEKSMEYSLSDIDYEKLLEQRKLFLSYANDGNIESARNIIFNILEEIKFVDIQLVQDFVINLLVGLNNQLQVDGTNMHFEFDNFTYTQVMKYKTIEEIKNWCKNILLELEPLITSKEKNTEGKVIHSAKEYIRENMSKDISLEEVSEHVYLNSVYFSRLFKQQTGETFTDYLIKLRMEKAKVLLNNNEYKVYEVCDMIGYKNTKYFYKIFKRYTGATPTEYRIGR